MAEEITGLANPNSHNTSWRIGSIIAGSIGNLVEWYDWYVYSAFSKE